MIKNAFAYTHERFMDKLEEVLLLALYHYYLVGLAVQNNLQQELHHWERELKGFLAGVGVTLLHSAKFSNRARTKAFYMVVETVTQKDKEVREEAVNHFEVVWQAAFLNSAWSATIAEKAAEDFWQPLLWRAKHLLTQ